MKRILILLSIVIAFTNFSFSQDIYNCRILSEIFDNCVNNKEINSCRDRGIALYYSLRKANIDNKISKTILKLCIFYCTNPNLWDKKSYEKACINGFNFSQ